MELNEYQDKAMETCMETCYNVSYMSLGLTSEVGELTGKLAKTIRKGDAYIGTDRHDSDLHYDPKFYNDNERFTHWETELKHELGDILWFCAGIADTMGWQLDEISQMNLDKLQSRKQRGVIDGNGDLR